MFESIFMIDDEQKGGILKSQGCGFIHAPVRKNIRDMPLTWQRSRLVVVVIDSILQEKGEVWCVETGHWTMTYIFCEGVGGDY